MTFERHRTTNDRLSERLRLWKHPNSDDRVYRPRAICSSTLMDPKPRRTQLSETDGQYLRTILEIRTTKSRRFLGDREQQLGHFLVNEPSPFDGQWLIERPAEARPRLGLPESEPDDDRGPLMKTATLKTTPRAVRRRENQRRGEWRTASTAENSGLKIPEKAAAGFGVTHGFHRQSPPAHPHTGMKVAMV